MATVTTLLRDVLGGKTSRSFEKRLGLSTVGGLLRHYPRRYTVRGELTDLADLADLAEGDEVTVGARIKSAKLRRIPGRRLSILEVVISSGGSAAHLSFFNQQWRERELLPGRQGMFAGKVSRFRDKLQLNSPDYILLDDDDEHLDVGFAGALIPVYPAASDLPSWTIARSVRVVLDSLDELVDPLPPEVRARAGLLELDRAIHQIHLPADDGQWRDARRRLAFDEAFTVQLMLAQRRHAVAADPAVARTRVAGGLVDAFEQRLPFVLTDQQRQISLLIEGELAAEHPMHRLLQGEVGSGKTVVALRAMLQVVDAGGQAALLAPTEVLAAQHAATVESLLGELARAGRLDGSDLGTRLVLLTGSMSASARRAALLDIASGAAGIVIGTHALIQDQVSFADLGMVVVDEQHRFGVEQRDALRGKASRPPHLLVMTATPIPRTVAMTVFGDLETSELRELPAGRQEVRTTVVPAEERPAWYDRVWQRVREEVAQGRQAYVVCPRIGDTDPPGPDAADRADADTDPPDADADADGAEVAGAAGVLATHAELSAGPLAGLRLAVLHGRLPADQKARVMADFAAGDCDVLVATTVVEVGVDVPNATVMVVLDADRFGISQLHQLRGRIGRGGLPGVCLLVTRMPVEHPATARLADVAATTDGFALALSDLRQRREGDILGTDQSGRRSHLKLLSLLRDERLILLARAEASRVIDTDPTLAAHPLLEEMLWDALDAERSEYLHKS